MEVIRKIALLVAAACVPRAAAEGPVPRGGAAGLQEFGPALLDPMGELHELDVMDDESRQLTSNGWGSPSPSSSWWSGGWNSPSQYSSPSPEPTPEPTPEPEPEPSPERTEWLGYEFFHDGHCADGWLNNNMVQQDLPACAGYCRATPPCGFFAFAVASSTCALYHAAAGCPDDNDHPDHDAYRLITSTVTATSTQTMAGYVFLREGHCAAGWIQPNTVQSSVFACAEHCRPNLQCGYFAFVEGSGTCAIYDLADDCPSDGHFLDHDAYRLIREPTTTESSSTSVTTTSIHTTTETSSSAHTTTETGTATSTQTMAGYEFLHDGHCALGYLNMNTVQQNAFACAQHCRTLAICGYFAFAEAIGTCALYHEADGCPDDNLHPDHNAYRLIREPTTTATTMSGSTATSTATSTSASTLTTTEPSAATRAPSPGPPAASSTTTAGAGLPAAPTDQPLGAASGEVQDTSGASLSATTAARRLATALSVAVAARALA